MAVLAGLAVLFGALFLFEARTSSIEARIFAHAAQGLTYRLEPGPSDSVRFPEAGPFDLRRGYTFIPEVTATLRNGGYHITAQARSSPKLLELTDRGLFTIYPQPPRAGLFLLDRAGDPLYSAAFPQRVYASFDSIPPIVVKTLLYIENRELLDPRYPDKNPAVEWDRLAKALFDQVLGVLRPGQAQPGGSTLATQIEKFQHSPEGRTSSFHEKLRQMLTASIRAYRRGRNTEQARREIVTEYLNSVPLAAIAGYGEVNGLGDGLWAWYDLDFAAANRLLREAGQPESTAGSPAEAAATYKKVLSLFIAHRRPTVYLVIDRQKLGADTDRYLGLLAAAGVISPRLRDAALAVPLDFRHTAPVVKRPSYIERKAANAVRTRLLSLLGLDQLYRLDRIDLRAETTLDGPLERRVTGVLDRLRRPAVADSMGLRGYRLLEKGDPSGVIYSFTLYESTPRGNLLRIQADNYDQPLDINEGARLDLGSTAKFRTLVTYLEAVEEVHETEAGKSRADLAGDRREVSDPIRLWGLDYLASGGDTTLPAMLNAALDRTYSANPQEKFFTGGGVHTFVNFNSEDNGKVLAVREGLRNSVNLVFIRLMRDIVRYQMPKVPGYDPALLADMDFPGRRDYLARFADKEGRDYLHQFWKRYLGTGADGSLELLATHVYPGAKRLAEVYRYVRPGAGVDSLRAFLDRHVAGAPVSAKQAAALFVDFAPGKNDLQDTGYLAGVHPLELWMVRYLQTERNPTWDRTAEAAAAARQESYKWLFSTKSLEKQNKRIRILLEEDAFRLIQEDWKRLGYPFDSLTPSYAAAIGASGDRPAALAELMGIIVNDGVRMPSQRMTRLHFGEGTPYETIFDYENPSGTRVLSPAVAEAVRGALIDVVQNGTARRAYGAFKLPDGTEITVGGKTGTGDHRFDTYGRGGQLIESRVVNRTATFVFFIGDRFFGSLTAYVPGPEAAGYAFTSALPVQLLARLAPDLMPMVGAAPASPAPPRTEPAQDGPDGD